MTTILDLKSARQALKGHFDQLRASDVCIVPQGIALDVRWFDRENLVLKIKDRHLWRGFLFSKLEGVSVASGDSKWFGQTMDGRLLLRDHFVQPKNRKKEFDFVGVVISQHRANQMKSSMIERIAEVYPQVMKGAKRDHDPPCEIDPAKFAEMGHYLFTFAMNLRKNSPLIAGKNNQFLPSEPWPTGA